MASYIPSTQRAAVLRGAYGELHSVENDYPVTSPGQNEVLVKLEAAGICAGDVQPRDGSPPAPKVAIRPLVAGHEGIGSIVSLGSSVTNFQVGDRVGTGWRRSTCHACDQCKTGNDNLCQAAVVNGYSKDGTFQEYIVLPASNLIRIPPSVRPASELAPLLCAGGTALAAVRAANILRGEWLCVTGAAGGVGSLAIQYAKHLGYHVIAVDSVTKRERCEDFGAVFIDYEDSESLVQRVKAVSRDAVRATLVCSPSAQSYTAAIAWSGVGATIVCIGIAGFNIHVGQLMARGLQLKGQANAKRQDIEDALAFSNEGIVPSIEIVQLASLDDALDKLKNGQATNRQVLVFE